MCAGFFIAAVCFAIALYLTKKENEELSDMLHDQVMAEIKLREPKYEPRREFVIIDKEAPNATYTRIKKVESEGYKFDKEKSFPELLCFTKWVEIKDEAPAES
jgi:spore coat polysaccharide biosynthesis predicted glycosyltransferase SpsG